MNEKEFESSFSFFPFRIMKKLITLLFLSCFTLIYSQKYTLYKTGRPQDFAYNNAEKIVAKNWKIEFKYFPFDGVNFDLLDSINAVNKKTTDLLEAKKGAKWQDEFLMEVNFVLEKTNQVRKLIDKEIVTLNSGTEKLIHFEHQCLQNRYKAYLVGQVLEKGERKFYILQTYKVNLKKQSFKLIEEKQRPLHFSYPENGIE